jgi:glycine/D-amino acid oxidase-like deaminating enzyme
MTAHRSLRDPAVTTTTDPRISKALRDADPTPFWLDSPAAPDPGPPLTGLIDADLAVVGGGFTGLWASLLAKEADPGAGVVVLEAGRVGWQGSGRNGGFCMSTLTHGAANGLAKFPDEIDRLEQLGRETLDAIEATCARHAIDCAWERTGEANIATAGWQVDGLREAVRDYERLGRPYEWFEGEAARNEFGSPLVEAMLWDKDLCAMIDPARLAWGLAAAGRAAGVAIHEGSPVTAIDRDAAGVVLTTPAGGVRAQRVVLATNGFAPLLRRLRYMMVPIYDYALVTEPLTAAQWDEIGWKRRMGISDSANHFHYFRRTADGRILWGGYDAIYHFGSRVRPQFDVRDATFAKLARHLFELLPHLEGTRFTHAWGGVIDVSTRFCPFFGTALGGRLAYSLGYTGMGVGASRFGAQVALDLLSGERTGLTELKMVRGRPIPWPPEPLRWGAVEATQRSMAWADHHEGERNRWLRLLDRFGVGFDT